MIRPGPPLETLTRRLADTPPEFLEEPRIGNTGRIRVAALVNDLLLMHGARAPEVALLPFEPKDARTDRNRLALTMIASWLLADEWLLQARPLQAAVLHFLDEAVPELARSGTAQKFTSDPDRREELVRVALDRLGYRPEGETEAQATDRLSSISGSERRRLLAASREAEKRAREIREALARKAAEEAADKWSRD